MWQFEHLFLALFAEDRLSFDGLVFFGLALVYRLGDALKGLGANAPGEVTVFSVNHNIVVQITLQDSQLLCRWLVSEPVVFLANTSHLVSRRDLIHNRLHKMNPMVHRNFSWRADVRLPGILLEVAGPRVEHGQQTFKCLLVEVALGCLLVQTVKMLFLGVG